MARAIQLMHQHEQKDEALRLLTGHQLTAAKEYQEGIALLLADHYKSTEQDVEAARTLDAGLKQFPRSQSLLYSRACSMHHSMILQEQKLTSRHYYHQP